MARRSNVNPAKVKADLASLESRPPEQVFQRRIEVRRRLSVALLSLLSAALLTASFVPLGQWYLAYVALVPWAMALDGGRRRRWALSWAWIAGAVFWALNLYWLTWITWVGYAASVFYLSLYWLAAACVLRPAMRRDWPMWLVLPVVWVALEYLRAHVIGFPWFYMAHSQYARTALIQIADATGPYGVSFFVLMVNGMVLDVLDSPLFVRGRKGPRLSRQMLAAVLAAAAAAALLLGYGFWRLSQNRTRPGPVVAVVQHAFPISLFERGTPSEVIFQAHLGSTREIAEEFRQRGAPCDLVVWPETMLPMGMNAELLDVDPAALPEAEVRSIAAAMTSWSYVKDTPVENLRAGLGLMLNGGGRGDGAADGLRARARQLGEMSRRLQCPILAGGTTLHRNERPTGPHDLWVSQNSALWFDRGARNSAEYSKMHLVPFSEYVPLKYSWPAAHRALRWFVPDVMPQLAPGEQVTRFDIESGGETFRAATPICFEGVFARICRKMAAPKEEGGRKVKSADILINLSNDGWFVWPWGKAPASSAEHPQHLVQYCFRAVENRTPVVRAVNTGISGLLSADGRVESIVSYQDRTLISGTLILDGAVDEEGRLLSGHGPRILVDERVSLYSQIGDAFAAAVGVAAFLLTGRLVWIRLRTRKGSER